MTRADYLIVGNSAGGIGGAEAIREVDAEGSIAIIGAEPYAAYSRPNICGLLAGRYRVDELAIRPADFYERNRISLHLGNPVTRLDLPRKMVEIEGGGSFEWVKLLLATGGRVDMPPIAGLDAPNVFAFTSIEDAQRIRQALTPASRAIVLGAGLIGLSATHALHELGVAVTLVEKLGRVLVKSVDATASETVERAIRQAGVRLILNASVREFLKGAGGRVNAMALEGEQPVPCDLVVVATGITPRRELASAAGLAVKRGVLVNEHMRTSAADVFACGDLAQAPDFFDHASVVVPTWPNAYISGRVAGMNMAGRKTEAPGAIGINAINYFGVAIVNAGIIEPEGPEFEALTSKSADGSAYSKIVLRRGRIHGLLFVGDIARSGIMYGLMRNRTDVSGFKEELFSSSLGLTALPGEVKDVGLHMAREGGIELMQSLREMGVQDDGK